MKLTDLNPVFVRVAGPGTVREQADFTGAQGMWFDLPIATRDRVLVFFRNPRAASPAPESFKPAPRWTVSGTGFHDLTLEPSVDVPGLWHGWIKNGEAK